MTKKVQIKKGGVPAPFATLCLAVQAGQPVLLLSEPGTGKTATVEALARSLGRPLHTLSLSQMEPTDLGGMPGFDTDEQSKIVRYFPQKWAREAAAEANAVVFLDEISATSVNVQNAALRVVQHGIVGDVRLPETTSFVLAGNNADSNAGARLLTAAMANRILHLPWGLHYDEWRAGMLSGWRAREPVMLPAEWRAGIDSKRALVVSFTDTNPTLVQSEPEDRESQAGAWPSGRTWDLVATMLAAADAAGYGPKSDVAGYIVRGLVGEACGVMFATYVANLDLPDPEKILADPKGHKLPKRQDQILATLDAVVAAAAREHPSIASRYDAGWAFIARMLNTDDRDLAIPASRTLIASSSRIPGAAQRPGYVEAMKLVATFLGKSGIDYGATA